jgi:putative acetyltransferase
MNLKIRQEITADFIDIYEISKQAFGQENEGKLVGLLRKSEAYIPELSIVAILDDTLIGHILFTKIQIIDHNKTEYESLALAPMAVKPEFQHKGIGGHLIKYSFDVARNLGYKSIVVLGHKVFYRKFGFDTASKWNIKSPFKLKDEENFMVMELVNGGLNNVSGLVKYSKEFEAI